MTDSPHLEPRDRLASNSFEGLPELGGVSFGEPVYERLKSLAGDFQELNHCWKERLRVVDVISADMYFAGRFSLLFDLEDLPGDRSYSEIAVAFGLRDSGPEAVNVCGVDHHVGARGDEWHNQKHVMLLPVAQFVEEAERPGAIIGKVLVEAQVLREKRNGIVGALLYRRSSDGRYKAFSVAGDGKCCLSLTALGPIQPHPCAVEGVAKIGDGICRKAGDDERNSAQPHEDDASIPFGVIFGARSIGVFIKPGIDSALQRVDHFAGPFNLERGVMK